VDFNKDKYYVNDSDRLTEAEKLQMAKDLLELERQGIFEYRDGTWGLADGVEVEETADGPVARFRKTQGAMSGQLAEGGEEENEQ
jgi:hypothetical protein